MSEFNPTQKLLDGLKDMSEIADRKFAIVDQNFGKFSDDLALHRDTYNDHLKGHAALDEYMRHVVQNHNNNAYVQRQHTWMIFGVLALAAFALGRTRD